LTFTQNTIINFNLAAVGIFLLQATLKIYFAKAVLSNDDY